MLKIEYRSRSHVVTNVVQVGVELVAIANTGPLSMTQFSRTETTAGKLSEPANG